MTFQIYSKAGCIFCDAAMELMDKKQIEYKEMKIDPVNGDLSDLKFMVEQGHKTVPQIYDDYGDHIGGYEDLKKFLIKEEWPDNPAECHAL